MPSKTLSAALADLLRKGSGSCAPRLLRISKTTEAGGVTVNDGGVRADVEMTNDEPQQAGTREWVIETDDGKLIGLGRG